MKIISCNAQTASTYEPMWEICWEINTSIELDANEWKAINKKNPGRESRLNSFYMAVTALLLNLNPNIDRYAGFKIKNESIRSKCGKKVISLKYTYARTPQDVVESFGLNPDDLTGYQFSNLLTFKEETKNVINVDFINRRVV